MNIQLDGLTLPYYKRVGKLFLGRVHYKFTEGGYSLFKKERSSFQEMIGHIFQ